MKKIFGVLLLSALMVNSQGFSFFHKKNKSTETTTTQTEKKPSMWQRMKSHLPGHHSSTATANTTTSTASAETSENTGMTGGYSTQAQTEQEQMNQDTMVAFGQ